MKESKISKEPIHYFYLDLIKALAIIMVCSYHFSWIGDISFSSSMDLLTATRRFFFGINSTCVPLFFMVNGALLLSKSQIDIGKHLKKTLWLFVQFWIWETIAVGVIHLHQGMELFPDGVYSLMNGYSDLDLSYSWFIVVLIGIYFIFPFIYREFSFCSPKHSFIYPFMIVLFAFYFIPVVLNTFLTAFASGNDGILHLSFLSKMLPFSGLVGPMLLYFLIGGIFHTNLDKIQKIPVWVPSAGFCIGALALYGRWFLESSQYEYTWDNVYSAYVSLPCMVMSASLFILISKISFSKVPEPFKKCIQIFGSNTLAVYYWHWIFGYTLLGQAAAHISQRGLFVNFVKAFLIVMVFSFLSHVLRRIPVLRKLIQV